MSLRKFLTLTLGLSLLGATPAAAAPVFFGPSEYLSSADIPSGFYESGPVALEDFEDGSLDFGITASNGTIRSNQDKVDSVDADDGVIDGSGNEGSSLFFSTGPSGGTELTFSFPHPVVAAALVQTDGRDSVTTVEAFGPGMTSLGTWGPFSFVDDSATGETAEDRFLGVQAPSGITALRISVDFSGMEVDHVQYGARVPEPATAVLLGLGMVALGGMRRRATA